MTIDFRECRAKIERASEHRKALEEIIAPVLIPESKFIEVSAKLDLETGHHVFRVAAIPESWRLKVGVIVGDVVHNLRSALDYLFWQLYCHHIGVPKTDRESRQVQFPIEDSSQRLTNKGVHLSKIPTAQWAVISNAQPYCGPDPNTHPLRVLRDLSNTDKHRILTPLLSQTDQFHFSVEVETRYSWADNPRKWSGGAQRLEVGAEIMQMSLFPDVDAEVPVAGYLVPSIRLPEGNLQIISGVNQMIECVSRIVNDIATLA